MYVKLPPEDILPGEDDRVGELRLSLYGTRDAAMKELTAAQKAKVDGKPLLRPGEDPPHTRSLKLAKHAAVAAHKMAEKLFNDLPAFYEGEDGHMIQFEWLPKTVREYREEVQSKLKGVDEELSKMTAAVEARKVGKQKMLYVDAQMAELREKELPKVDPALEAAGSIQYEPLHVDFYHSQQLTAGRRALAEALARHAARLLIAADRQISILDAETLGGAFKGKLALDPSVTLQRSKALLLMNQDASAAIEPITPERVLDMAERLGIILTKATATHDAELEFCFLWIAVEALRAPLPPLWQKLENGTYRHAVSFEVTTEHPLLCVYREHVEHERCRKKPNRPFQSLERFMLFAIPEGEGDNSFTFYNFATRQHVGGRKLPAEAVAEQAARRPPPPPPKKTAHKATAASINAQADGQKVKSAAEKDKEAARRKAERAIAPKLFTKEQLAALRAQASTVRKTALSLRPRALPELLVAARMFSVDLVQSPSDVWLVDLCLACDHLPVGWSPVPREFMSKMAHKHNKEEIMEEAANSSMKEVELAERHVRSVTWLPPLERLWHVATTGQAPSQYSHHSTSLTTERHPLSGFVRSATGVDPV